MDDRKKLQRLLGSDRFSCRPVQGGKSGARTYRVQLGTDVWTAKLFPAKPRLGEWYALLNEIGEPRLACAKVCVPVGPGEAGTLAPWVEGVSLERRLVQHPEQAERWARQAAALVRRLHAQPVDEARLNIRFSAILDGILSSACARAEENLRFLPHLSEYCACLKRARSDQPLGKVCLLHKDLHTGNFVIQGDELYLIDFENGGLGECEQDFIRLLNIPETCGAFLPHFLRYYLDGAPAEPFLARWLRYDILALFQEAERRARQGDLPGAAEASRRLYARYDGLRSPVPQIKIASRT